MIKFMSKFIYPLLAIISISETWSMNAGLKLEEIEQKLLDLENRIQQRKSGSTPPLLTKTRQPIVLPEPLDRKDQIEIIDEYPKTPIGELGNEDYLLSNSKKEDIEIPSSSGLNRIGFHLGFTLPNDTMLGMGEISFDSGIGLGIEYFRYFNDQSYLGLGFEIKAFKAAGIWSEPFEFKYSGDCSISEFYFTLGQEWDFYESVSLLTQASIGFAFSNYEINFVHHNPGSANIERIHDINDTSFYYSFLVGINYQWNKNWQSALYYELEGHAEAGELDYQSFNQIGVKTSFAF
jgi:hypothetical protein